MSALALPAGAAEKMARGVTPPGVTAPRPTHAVDAMLGDQIQVRGYDVAPEVVAPGGEVTVTTHFATKKRLGPEWRLFFHLEGPGRLPQHGPRPRRGPHAAFERWRPGQSIRDTWRIPIPPGGPRGTYTLYIGAYRGAEHLPVTPDPRRRRGPRCASGRSSSG